VKILHGGTSGQGRPQERNGVNSRVPGPNRTTWSRRDKFATRTNEWGLRGEGEGQGKWKTERGSDLSKKLPHATHQYTEKVNGGGTISPKTRGEQS